MGYDGERASLNQYSSLYSYCLDKVIPELRELFYTKNKQDKELDVSKLKYVYTSNPDSQFYIPFISFDGGIASLFQGQITETSLIKVTAGCSPDDQRYFSEEEMKNIIFHTFVGKLNYYKSIAKDENEILQSELSRLLSVDEMLTCLAVLDLNEKSFRTEFSKLIDKWKDKSALKDSIRELLEWGLVFDFIVKREKDKNSNYLIVKDGNLFPHPNSVTGLFLNQLKTFLIGKNELISTPRIIGAVKNSRYTGESIIGLLVKKIAQQLPSHTFFQLPEKFEAMADKEYKAKPFVRYFLSLFKDRVYEIQVPQCLNQNQDELKRIFDRISSQTTFLYGGSISINSFAHIMASISQAEGKLLEQRLEDEINGETSND